MYSIGVFKRNGRSVIKNAPVALRSVVSVMTHGSPMRRRKAVKCMSNRGFRRRSPGRERNAWGSGGLVPMSMQNSTQTANQ